MNAPEPSTPVVPPLAPLAAAPLAAAPPVDAAAANVPPRSALVRCWNAFESLLERAGEHLNPILVKEARQSLKSRQFTVTFVLVLTAAWFWSLLGLAWIGPQAYYAAHGPGLLYGYALILLFALILIVPYGAFRSLAAELEDHTYELLSITTLDARQVIGGKLASAGLQILIYLSAISPCIAFTYLLRGVDVLTIAILVCYAGLASLGLSLVGLLLATCAMERYRQVVASVVWVLWLGGLFVSSCAAAEGLIGEALPVDLSWFFIFNAALLTAYVSYFVLFYLAAAVQLSFASSNRSTSVRIAMVAQQVLFSGWMGYAWLIGPQAHEIVLVFLILSGVHWYAMGIFLTGEPDRLSPRVMRNLPQSFLGRALFTGFIPGPATGYLFVLSNLVAVFGLSLVVVRLRPSAFISFMNPAEKVRDVGLLGLCYVAIYLGLGKLLLGAARRVTQVGVVLRLMIHLLLLAIGAAVPVMIQMSLNDPRSRDYSLLQISNPLWTMAEVLNSMRGRADVDTLRIVLPVVAALVVLANLPSAIAELRQIRIAKPVRVADEDAELAALAAPDEPIRTSPWG
jgi:hypothetical protein